MNKIFHKINDKHTINEEQLHIGINGHYQYKWSKNFQEKILQYYYQLIRTNNNNELEYIYKELIFELFTNNKLNKKQQISYLDILYTLIANTRDALEGKGEYELTYMMILVWTTIYYEYIELYNYKDLFNQLAKKALELIVAEQKLINGYKTPPLGSFKDIKYFLNYWKNKSPNTMFSNNNETHPVFYHCIHLLNRELAIDEYKYENNIGNISLVSKWIPREKSKKFGWINKHLAFNYYNHIKSNDNNDKNNIKNIIKYRKLIATLNKEINTVQIKQCSKQWADIDFNKHTTSITILKQKFAFANKNKNGTIRTDENDRIKCSINFNKYIKDCQNDNKYIKNNIAAIPEFVKYAISLPNQDNNPEISELINKQWNNMFNNKNYTNNTNTHYTNTDKFIIMVDTSLSMTNDNCIPLYNAIGIGILLAEKSILGKRILTFSHTPNWVNLEESNDFISKVKKIKQTYSGGNTNFYAAFNKIIEAYQFLDINPILVEDYKLLILSDMQIDFDASELYKYTMIDTISKKFEEAGLNSQYKKPYKVPTVVFWNLRKTNGFPAKSTDKNVIMISGYNQTLLNNFINKGTELLNKYTPWSMLIHILSNKRYDEFTNTIVEVFFDVFTK